MGQQRLNDTTSTLARRTIIGLRQGRIQKQGKTKTCGPEMHPSSPRTQPQHGTAKERAERSARAAFSCLTFATLPLLCPILLLHSPHLFSHPAHTHTQTQPFSHEGPVFPRPGFRGRLLLCLCAPQPHGKLPGQSPLLPSLHALGPMLTPRRLPTYTTRRNSTRPPSRPALAMPP